MNFIILKSLGEQITSQHMSVIKQEKKLSIFQIKSKPLYMRKSKTSLNDTTRKNMIV